MAERRQWGGAALRAGCCDGSDGEVAALARRVPKGPALILEAPEAQGVGALVFVRVEQGLIVQYAGTEAQFIDDAVERTLVISTLAAELNRLGGMFALTTDWRLPMSIPTSIVVVTERTSSGVVRGFSTGLRLSALPPINHLCRSRCNDSGLVCPVSSSARIRRGGC